jgi:hypothetical protein
LQEVNSNEISRVIVIGDAVIEQNIRFKRLQKEDLNEVEARASQ